MSPQMEKQILKRLERIEDLLVKIVPIQGELSQNDVLQIIEDGRKADKTGKTKGFEKLSEAELKKVEQGKAEIDRGEWADWRKIATILPRGQAYKKK